MDSVALASTPSEESADGARPTALLPFSHLVRISAYWLGLTAIDGAVGLFVNNRLEFDHLVPTASVGTTFFMVTAVGAVVGIIIQPTVGYLSDYTVSRWGRRKPYIVFGSLVDVLFLLAIANSSSVLALAVFFLLLQVSTNIARGPFQGYVPDLVAEPQVGMASGLVGLMQVVGNVTGFGLVALSVGLGNMPLSLAAVAVVELVTMLSVVLRVGAGLPPKPRHGRSWPGIARDAWATDILRERSYVWLLVSRLAFMTGGALLTNFVLQFLGRTMGMNKGEANQMFIVVLGVVVISSMVAILPSSRLSDHVGRKALIYAACGIGGVGIAIVAFAPSIPVALVGAALFGASSGTFLAVDWALMTDIIPRASAGRYMGLSNVATGASGPIGIALGGLTLDLVTRAGGAESAPRVVFAIGFVLFAMSAIALRPVIEPRRNRGAGSARGPALSGA